MSEVSVVVVTYNALPWLEQCLASVRGVETVVVDHGSTDGTVALVRDRFPDVALVEQENRGLALVAFADANPRAAVVGPRLRYPDGRLQRSVRGFPTLWRLATEFFFLRKLAPRSRFLNAFYGGGFDHESVLDAEVLMGAVWLVRREAVMEVGPADEAFFLFSEETDWAYRFRAAGWQLLFFPGAGATHVYAASHKGLLFVENLRGQLRFLRKHRGEAYAERARRLLLVALRLRAALYRGRRGSTYREGAAWLASGRTDQLLG